MQYNNKNSDILFLLQQTLVESAWDERTNSTRLCIQKPLAYSLGLTLCPVQEEYWQSSYLLLFFFEIMLFVSFITLGVGQSEACSIMLISRPALCQSPVGNGLLPTPSTVTLALKKVNLNLWPLLVNTASKWWWILKIIHSELRSL